MRALIVWGAQDTWVPVDRTHRLADTIPHSTLKVIDRAGHLVHHGGPVELATSLSRWLSRHHRR